MTHRGARGIGAYYTGQDIAEFMAHRAVGKDVHRVLEPSFGDGSFLRALKPLLSSEADIFGVELREDAYASAISNDFLQPENAFARDFLDVPPFPVDLVIGNPPFVRLRHLRPEAARLALSVSREALGSEMEPSGSLWMPFVLHAMRFLRRGGSMALVLPYEMTYVRYARSLWKHLAASFDSLDVMRVREPLFPEILQEVVLFAATGYGGSCSTVQFQAYERATDLWQGTPSIASTLSVRAIAAGDREFTKALLSPTLRQLLDEPLAASTIPVRDRAVFNIGYVTGDKAFFHPSDETISQYNLSPKSLRLSVAATRALRGTGVRTSALRSTQRQSLFLPDPDSISDGERRYVAAGAEAGVAQRYKCRVRDPWFVVPGVIVPDLLLSVFSSDPLLLINDAQYVASNSLLCGSLKSGSIMEFVSAWYTSLTRLYLELEVHSLGGGVFVLIPGEVGRVRMLRSAPNTSVLDKVDQRLRAGLIGAAYEAGDAMLTRRGVGLSNCDVSLVRHGIETLRQWRTRVRPAARAGIHENGAFHDNVGLGEVVQKQFPGLEGPHHPLNERPNADVDPR